MTTIEKQKLKAYVIRTMITLRKNQRDFFRSIEKEKSLDDLLSPNQVIEELNISRKTFDRWREKGLKVLQDRPNSAIRVKRSELMNYLKNTRYDRLF